MAGLSFKGVRCRARLEPGQTSAPADEDKGEKRRRRDPLIAAPDENLCRAPLNESPATIRPRFQYNPGGIREVRRA